MYVGTQSLPFGNEEYTVFEVTLDSWKMTTSTRKKKNCGRKKKGYNEQFAKMSGVALAQLVSTA
jgi:hypothetical protein